MIIGSPLLGVGPLGVGGLAGWPAGRNFNRGHTRVMGRTADGAEYAVSSQLVFASLDGSDGTGALFIVSRSGKYTLFRLFPVSGFLGI